MKFLRILMPLVVAVLVNSCKQSLETEVDHSSLSDWTAATHEVGTPNYAVVFNQSELNTIEISISASDWDAINTDMISKAGYAFGSRSSSAGGVSAGPVAGGSPPTGAVGGMAGGGNALDLISGDPIYVPVSLKFNGKEWYKVGFRLKGNSSLSNAWGAGIYKLPFRLDFDEFEDDYPVIKNQRFYGFKQLSFSPGQGDNSLMRDKLTSDLFREAGIPTAQTAFYKLYINFGNGSKYCGVYTMVEIVDDTMTDSQFSDDDGNIYKPESTLSSFVEAEFEKKNNETKADYSDVKAFVTALNASNRTTDPATWRANLEKTFDVNHFLKYLAINNTIVNWDAYGAMAHNYYLYTPASTGQIKWIPWDFNLSMQGTSNISTSNQSDRAVSLTMNEVTSSWPLLYNLAKDANYYAQYKAYIKAFNDDFFQASRISAIIDKHHALIGTAVSQEVSPYSYLSNTSDYTSALTTLKQHIVTRNQAVVDFLK